MWMKRSLMLVVVVCCMWMVSCDHNQIPEPSFLSTLVSRVLQTEPREIREFRTSCIREPGCRWKCSPGNSAPQSQCLCVCGSQKDRRKTS